MYRVSIVYVSCIYRVYIVTISGIMAAKVVKTIGICKFFITFFLRVSEKSCTFADAKDAYGHFEL